MTTQEILTTLQADIHSTVFATLDTHGLPQTCVIDLMLADAAGLYFLTVRGKAFYTRLTAKPFVAFTGIKGRDTLSTLAISLRGAVRSIGKERRLSGGLYQRFVSPQHRHRALSPLRQLLPHLSGWGGGAARRVSLSQKQVVHGAITDISDKMAGGYHPPERRRHCRREQ